jgi:tRNA threonylcarbamoyladenosine biosynthesis protein TsaB
MRVLAIETSTSLASVALVEGGMLVLGRSHARPKQSAEKLLPMIAELLAEAGWQRSSIERLGVSIGPGSFTGLRVGIACAQGLALGLDIPLLGVTSLRAMARLVPDSLPGVRCPVLDARRSEVFAAAYGSGPGTPELLEPQAFAVQQAVAAVSARLTSPSPLVWIGSGCALLGIEPTYSSTETDGPSALSVGLLAGELDAEDCPPIPVYVRDAGASLPPARSPNGALSPIPLRS